MTHQAEFTTAIRGYDQILSWVGNSTKTRQKMTANIYGLIPFPSRLAHLHARYQYIVDTMDNNSPLQICLREGTCKFTHYLRASPIYQKFLVYLRELPGPAKAEKSKVAHLDDFLWVDAARLIAKPTGRPSVKAAQSNVETTTTGEGVDLIQRVNDKSKPRLVKDRMLRLIPFENRISSPRLADIVLSAPIGAQRLLLNYRRGVFAQNKKCLCGQDFHRGHEDKCRELRMLSRLNPWDRKLRTRIRANLGL